MSKYAINQTVACQMSMQDNMQYSLSCLVIVLAKRGNRYLVFTARHAMAGIATTVNGRLQCSNAEYVEEANTEELLKLFNK